MNKHNAIWLLEQSKSPLSLVDVSESEITPGSTPKYILTGICAEFDTPNDNNRIYKKEDYLKHLEYLKPQIEQGILLGSPDHDEDYHVSMRSVSHIIRDLWYDEADNTVKIKIELLPTRYGKDLIEIVKAGSPLFISSRATGYRDEQTGVVTIDTIYTYDVVYRPGFSNAKLTRISESNSNAMFIAPRLVETVTPVEPEFDKLRDKLISMLVGGTITTSDQLNAWINKYKDHYKYPEQGNNFIQYITKNASFLEVVGSVLPDYKYSATTPESTPLIENSQDPESCPNTDLNGNCIVTTIPTPDSPTLSATVEPGKVDPTQEAPVDSVEGGQGPVVAEAVDSVRFKVGDQVEFPESYPNLAIAGESFIITAIKGNTVTLKNKSTSALIQYDLTALSNNESKTIVMIMNNNETKSNPIGVGDAVKINNKNSEFYNLKGVVSFVDGDSVVVTINGIDRLMTVADVELDLAISESLKADLEAIVNGDKDAKGKIDDVLALSGLPQVFINTINSREEAEEQLQYVQDWISNANNWKDILENKARIDERARYPLATPVTASDSKEYRLVLVDFKIITLEVSENDKWQYLATLPIVNAISGAVNIKGVTITYDPTELIDKLKELELIHENSDSASSKDEEIAILNSYDELAQEGVAITDIIDSISTTVDLPIEDVKAILVNAGKITDGDFIIVDSATPVEDTDPDLITEAVEDTIQVTELFDRYSNSGTIIDVLDKIEVNTGLDLDTIKDILVNNGKIKAEDFTIVESATLVSDDAVVDLVTEAVEDAIQVTELFDKYSVGGATLIDVLDKIETNTGLDLDTIKDILVNNGKIAKDEFTIVESATLVESVDVVVGSKHVIDLDGDKVAVTVQSIDGSVVTLTSNHVDPYLRNISMDIEDFTKAITLEEDIVAVDYQSILDSVSRLEESVGLLTGMLQTILKENKILKRELRESIQKIKTTPSTTLVEGKTYMVKATNNGVERGTYVQYTRDGFVTEVGTLALIDESLVIPTTKDISESLNPITTLVDHKFPALKGCSKEVKAMFECLHPLRQEAILDSVDVATDDSIITAIDNSKSTLDFISALELCPAEYVGTWESLPQVEKEKIVSIFKLKAPKTPEEIVAVWHGLGLAPSYNTPDSAIITTGVDSAVLDLGYDINDVEI